MSTAFLICSLTLEYSGIQADCADDPSADTINKTQLFLAQLL